MRRRVRAVALWLIGSAIVACGNDPIVPDVAVSLISPSGDDPTGGVNEVHPTVRQNEMEPVSRSHRSSTARLPACLTYELLCDPAGARGGEGSPCKRDRLSADGVKKRALLAPMIPLHPERRIRPFPRG